MAAACSTWPVSRACAASAASRMAGSVPGGMPADSPRTAPTSELATGLLSRSRASMAWSAACGQPLRWAIRAASRSICGA